MSSGDIGSFDFWGSGWVSLEDRWGITGRMLQQKARNVYLSPGKEQIMYVAGEPYTTASGKVWTPYLTVCGAHLIEAFYIAIKRFKEHQHLNITLNHGVPDCTEINTKAPDDAITYFVDLGNVLNGFASSTSFLQVYKKVVLVSQGWEKKKKDDQDLDLDLD